MVGVCPLLGGLEEEDLAHMPPFPFPKELFPPGTFPEGMKFSTDFHMPPAVEELLEQGGPEALGAMFGAGGGGGMFGGGGGGSSDDEWEEVDAPRGGGQARGGGGKVRGGRGGVGGGGGGGSGKGGKPRGGASARGGRAGPSMASMFAGMGGGVDADDDLTEAEMEELMANMPPGMFEKMLREDAGTGGQAGEEAGRCTSRLHLTLYSLKAPGLQTFKPTK
jgi:hypothetical protein